MGYETNIRIAGDGFEEKNNAQFIGNDFTWEIALGYLFDKKSFLSKNEWQILIPQNSDDTVDEKPNPVNPTDLLSILDKIKKHLEENQDTLPFEIALDFDKMEKEGLSCEITINGSRCWIQGDSNVFEVYSKVKIVNHPMEPNEVYLWVEVIDKIEIEGRTYFLRKVTRYDRYNELISRITDYLVQAKNNKEKVYWILWT
jgi:desulfoferrodoxin (superoxide reductase-like protein)